MTTLKTAKTWRFAQTLAERVVTLLNPVMEKILVAGSVRRRKATVGDIEIVAIPRMGGFMQPHPLDELLFNAEQAGILTVNKGKSGPESKMKQILFEGEQIDLFLQPDRATWGVNFTLRTGSAEWSNWLVSPVEKGGAMPPGMRSKEARLWRGADCLETPEEYDVFRALGLPWIPPIARTAGFWRTPSNQLFAKSHQRLLADLDKARNDDELGVPFLGFSAGRSVTDVLSLIDREFDFAKSING